MEGGGGSSSSADRSRNSDDGSKNVTSKNRTKDGGSSRSEIKKYEEKLRSLIPGASGLPRVDLIHSAIDYISDLEETLQARVRKLGSSTSRPPLALLPGHNAPYQSRQPLSALQTVPPPSQNLEVDLDDPLRSTLFGRFPPISEILSRRDARLSISSDSQVEPTSVISNNEVANMPKYSSQQPSPTKARTAATSVNTNTLFESTYSAAISSSLRQDSTDRTSDIINAVPLPSDRELFANNTSPLSSREPLSNFPSIGKRKTSMFQSDLDNDRDVKHVKCTDKQSFESSKDCYSERSVDKMHDFNKSTSPSNDSYDYFSEAALSPHRTSRNTNLIRESLLSPMVCNKPSLAPTQVSTTTDAPQTKLSPSLPSSSTTKAFTSPASPEPDAANALSTPNTS